jgi:hypothetical protein
MFKMIRPVSGYSLLLFLAFSSHESQAAVFCVTTPIELQNALTAAAASPQDDEIRIKQGIYTPQQTFTHTSTNHGWLHLSGGWVQEGDNNCHHQIRSAAHTILDGAGQRQIMRLYYMPADAPVVITRYIVDNLSFRGGVGQNFERGGGLDISQLGDQPVYVEFWLQNLIVANNSGYFSGGVNLAPRYGYGRVVNSLFFDNSAPNSAYGHLAATLIGSEAETDLVIANNTFAYGTCPGNGTRGCGIGVGLGQTANMQLLNNLFWENTINDVHIEGMTAIGLGSGMVHYDSNRVPVTSGNIAPTVVNPLVDDPRFVDVNDRNFRLRDDSPFINAGLGIPPFFPLPFADLDGQLRTRFDIVDPGPYENQTWDFIFANGFQLLPN